MWESFKKILGIPTGLLIVGWILFNPHVVYIDSLFIANLTSQINSICLSLNLSYHFFNKDILGLLRFLEYFIFGSISVSVLKIYFKNLYQNVVNSMFFGLLVAVFEAYCRSFGVYRLEIKDVLYSFFEFCIGVLVICILSSVKPKKRLSLKYKKSNYIGRSQNSVRY